MMSHYCSQPPAHRPRPACRRRSTNVRRIGRTIGCTTCRTCQRCVTRAALLVGDATAVSCVAPCAEPHLFAGRSAAPGAAHPAAPHLWLCRRRRGNQFGPRRQSGRLRRLDISSPRAGEHGGTQPEGAAVWPTLCGPVRHRPDGRHVTDLLRMRARTGRGRCRHRHSLHSQRRLANAVGNHPEVQSGCLVSGVYPRRSRTHRSAGGPGGTCRLPHAGGYRGRAGGRQPREQRAQRIHAAIAAGPASPGTASRIRNG